jgi:hypothetical protein
LPKVRPQPVGDAGTGGPADDPGSPADGDDESLLARLVADFLATEEPRVRRYVDPTMPGAHGSDRTHSTMPATVPARAGARSSSLPAVRGQHVRRVRGCSSVHLRCSGAR